MVLVILKAMSTSKNYDHCKKLHSLFYIHMLDTKYHSTEIFVVHLDDTRIFKCYHPKCLQFWFSQYITSPLPCKQSPHRCLIFPLLRNTSSISWLNTVVLGVQYASLDQRPFTSFVPYQHLSCQPVLFQNS